MVVVVLLLLVVVLLGLGVMNVPCSGKATGYTTCQKPGAPAQGEMRGRRAKGEVALVLLCIFRHFLHAELSWWFLQESGTHQMNGFLFFFC